MFVQNASKQSVMFRKCMDVTRICKRFRLILAYWGYVKICCMLTNAPINTIQYQIEAWHVVV